VIPARPVHAADLPKRVLDGALARSNAGHTEEVRRARPAYTVGPPKASGKSPTAGWRCNRCDLDFIHWAAAQRHADGHHGGILQWVVRGLLEAVVR